MQKLSKLTAALVLAAAVAAPALAAPQTFVIDGTHTFPRFSYNHLGFSTQLSRFDTTTGKVVFDKVAKTGAVDIVIDTKSVSTGSATFKSTKVIFEGDKPAKIEGNLTLKGVTKPVTLTVTDFKTAPHPMLKKEAIGANATTTVKRTDFNMGKNVPYVGDEVRIDIGLEAIQQ